MTSVHPATVSSSPAPSNQANNRTTPSPQLHPNHKNPRLKQPTIFHERKHSSIKMHITVSMTLFLGLATALPATIPASAKSPSVSPVDFTFPVGFCDKPANVNDFRCLDSTIPTIPGGAGGPYRTPERQFECETACMNKTKTPKGAFACITKNCTS